MCPDMRRLSTVSLHDRKKPPARQKVNSTPFVRQYGILNNKWGALLCQKEYQTYESTEGCKEINHGSILKLADFYQVSTDYLLCRTDNRNPENIELTELHINDEVVELLKSERFNNRLLCEIISMKNSGNC